MRRVYREKRYVCGEYMEAYIYPVYETGRRRGGKRGKRKPSTEAQKKLNQRHREEKLTRLLHANFSPEDLEIHLTYAVQPGSDKEAWRIVQNFIRRVRRYMEKHGLGELRYIIVTERGTRSGRYHHHVTLHCGMDRDVLEQLWTKSEGAGYANTRRLQFNETGLEGLARYITKQHRSEDGSEDEQKAGKKAWSASRNLVDPEAVTRDGRVSARQAREMADDPKQCVKLEALYPGWTLTMAETFHNDVNGGAYLAVRFCREAYVKSIRRQSRLRESLRGFAT